MTPKRPPILYAAITETYWTWLWRPESYVMWHHTDSHWDSWMLFGINEELSDPEAVEIFKAECERSRNLGTRVFSDGD